MAVEAVQLHIFGALIMGIIIGIVELVFVHADEQGMRWLSHGLHAIPTCLIFTFIAMNVPYVMSILKWGWLNSNIAIYGIPVVIGLIATFKVKASAAIIQGHGSVGEKLGHAFIIGALIAASPWIWFVIYPMLPAVLKQWA